MILTSMMMMVIMMVMVMVMMMCGYIRIFRFCHFRNDCVVPFSQVRQKGGPSVTLTRIP